MREEVVIPGLFSTGISPEKVLLCLEFQAAPVPCSRMLLPKSRGLLILTVLRGQCGSTMCSGAQRETILHRWVQQPSQGYANKEAGKENRGGSYLQWLL